MNVNAKLIFSVGLLISSLLFLFGQIAGNNERTARVQASVQSPPPPPVQAQAPTPAPSLTLEPLQSAATATPAPTSTSTPAPAPEQKEETKEEPKKEQKSNPCPESRPKKKAQKKRKERVQVKQTEKKEEEKADFSDYGLVCKVGGECVLYKNGQVVREGKTIPQGKVLRISPSGVVFEKDGKLKQVSF